MQLLEKTLETKAFALRWLGTVFEDSGPHEFATFKLSTFFIKKIYRANKKII